MKFGKEKGMVIRMKMLKKKELIMGCVTAACMIAVVWCNPAVALANSEGTVTAKTAYIREKPDTDSEVIGSSSEGKKITIKDKTTDASGAVWYRVYVDGNTLGYIRSDLVKNEGGEVESVANDTADTSESQSESTTDDTASTADTSMADGAETQAETVMDAQYATISAEAAKIRTAPSTNNDVVERLEEGRQLVVSGQSNGSDGKVWYYVTFTGNNGAEKTGFVRSDLVTLGDMLPVEEEVSEEPEEEPVQEENVNNDYELKYEQDGNEYVWYLYDNVNQYKQKLEPILEAAALAQADGQSADTDTVVKQRIIIVVLVVLLVALITTVIIMVFKLRNAYYEDYEEDDDDEEEEEEDEEEPEEEVRPVRRKVRSEDTVSRMPEESERASRRKSVKEETNGRQKAERKSVVQEVTYEEEPDVKPAAKAEAKRKAKNFLLDDDDFEFEFLNMDDKDLR